MGRFDHSDVAAENEFQENALVDELWCNSGVLRPEGKMNYLHFFFLP